MLRRHLPWGHSSLTAREEVLAVITAIIQATILKISGMCINDLTFTGFPSSLLFSFCPNMRTTQEGERRAEIQGESPHIPQSCRPHSIFNSLYSPAALCFQAILLDQQLVQSVCETTSSVLSHSVCLIQFQVQG
uniref:Uncharacterized protein n=1 Tax=Geospiza parvula TaxID=87175 RepID=A0A8C3NL42_GEOPR